jgi:hypothetical protein
MPKPTAKDIEKQQASKLEERQWNERLSNAWNEWASKPRPKDRFERSKRKQLFRMLSGEMLARKKSRK